MTNDSERLAAQTRRLNKLHAWALKIQDKGHRVPVDTLVHRLGQIIVAGKDEQR